MRSLTSHVVIMRSDRSARDESDGVSSGGSSGREAQRLVEGGRRGTVGAGAAAGGESATEGRAVVLARRAPVATLRRAEVMSKLT